MNVSFTKDPTFYVKIINSKFTKIFSIFTVIKNKQLATSDRKKI